MDVAGKSVRGHWRRVNGVNTFISTTGDFYQRVGGMKSPFSKVASTGKPDRPLPSVSSSPPSKLLAASTGTNAGSIKSRSSQVRAAFQRELEDHPPFLHGAEFISERNRAKDLRKHAANEAERKLVDDWIAKLDRHIDAQPAARERARKAEQKRQADLRGNVAAKIPVPKGDPEVAFRQLCAKYGMKYLGYREGITGVGDKNEALTNAFRALSALDMAIKVNGRGAGVPLGIRVGVLGSSLNANARYVRRISVTVGVVDHAIEMSDSERTGLFHEYWHYLDNALGKHGSPATSSNPDLADMCNRLLKTAAYREYFKLHTGNRAYERKPEEVGARFFEAYIENRLKSKGIKPGTISGGTIHERPDFSARDFAEFGPTLESVLDKRGLLKAIELLAKSVGHDVSSEPRNARGEWTAANGELDFGMAPAARRISPEQPIHEIPFKVFRQAYRFLPIKTNLSSLDFSKMPKHADRGLLAQIVGEKARYKGAITGGVDVDGKPRQILTTSEDPESAFREAHENAVRAAAKAGKKIPPDVAADYPFLAGRVAARPQTSLFGDEGDLFKGCDGRRMLLIVKGVHRGSKQRYELPVTKPGGGTSVTSVQRAKNAYREDEPRDDHGRWTTGLGTTRRDSEGRDNVDKDRRRTTMSPRWGGKGDIRHKFSDEKFYRVSRLEIPEGKRVYTGMLLDYIIGPKTRGLYQDVLGTPVYVYRSDSRENGAYSRTHGSIYLNLNRLHTDSDQWIHTLAHEAAHAMRDARIKVGADAIHERSFDNSALAKHTKSSLVQHQVYSELLHEQTARRMANYALYGFKEDGPPTKIKKAAGLPPPAQMRDTPTERPSSTGVVPHSKRLVILKSVISTTTNPSKCYRCGGKTGGVWMGKPICKPCLERKQAPLARRKTVRIAKAVGDPVVSVNECPFCGSNSFATRERRLEHADRELNKCLDCGRLFAPFAAGKQVGTSAGNGMAESVFAPHKHASTQVNIDETTADHIRTWAANLIDPNDLAPDGFETDVHITVKYGLIDDDPVAVAGALRPISSIFAKIGGVSAFNTSPDHDVLYLSVVSPDLVRANKLIEDGVDCAPSDHGFYKPHLTIAYLKKGTAAKYLKSAAPDIGPLTFDRVVLSARDRKRTVIDLGGTSGTSRVALQKGILLLRSNLFAKAFNPDEPRDDHGRWTAELKKIRGEIRELSAIHGDHGQKHPWAKLMGGLNPAAQRLYSLRNQSNELQRNLRAAKGLSEVIVGKVEHDRENDTIRLDVSDTRGIRCIHIQESAGSRPHVFSAFERKPDGSYHYWAEDVKTKVEAINTAKRVVANRVSIPPDIQKSVLFLRTQPFKNIEEFGYPFTRLNKALESGDHKDHIKRRRAEVEGCKHKDEPCKVAGVGGFMFPARYCKRCGRIKMDQPRHHRLTSNAGPLLKAIAEGCFKNPRECGLRWITCHPHGDESQGIPLLVHDNGEEYTVVGGAGGRMNQQVFRKPKDQMQGRDAARREKAVEKKRQAIEALGEKGQQMRENAAELLRQAKEQNESLTNRVIDMIHGSMSGKNALDAVQEEARKRALKENAKASPEEQQEFADTAAKAAVTEAKNVAKELVQKALDRAAMRALGDTDVSGDEFKATLSGKQLVKKLTPEQFDDILHASASIAELKGRARAIQRALVAGDQEAVQGIESDIRPLSLDEARQRNLDRYLNEKDVDNQTALVKATDAAPEVTRNRNQANGAMDGLNSFCASVTGKAILRPDMVRKLGVEDAGRVAAAYLAKNGVDARTTAEHLRDRIGQQSAASVAAAIDKVREMDALVDHAKAAAAEGDGSVTTAQASILAANMSQQKYRFLNVTRGQLRAANALAHHLEHPSARPMDINGGSTATAAHALAHSFGLQDGDYEVDKAERGTGGGYRIRVQPQNIAKMAQPHGIAESDRNAAMDELRQDVEQNGGQWHPTGLSENIRLKPHQELGARAAGLQKRIVLNMGAGCISADTIIDDPLRGISMTVHEWMQRNMAPNVWALNADGEPVITRASVPFIKAFEPLYEVITESGKTIRVARGHRFLTRCGWRPLRHLSVGDEIAESRDVVLEALRPAGTPKTPTSLAMPCVSPRRSVSVRVQPRVTHHSGLSTASSPCCNSLLSQWQPLRDVCHPPSIEVSYQLASYGDENCSDRIIQGYQAGCRLSRHSNGGRPHLPSVIGPIFAPLQTGVPECSRCYLRAGDLACTRGHSHPYRYFCRPSTMSCDVQAVPLAYEPVEFQRGCDTAESTRTRSRSRALFGRRSSRRHSIFEYQRRALVKSKNETFAPPVIDNTTALTRVLSITKMEAAFIYDLEVFGVHNYLAHGVWNHNSGKTVTYYAAAADALSSGKVDRVLMSMPSKVKAQQAEFEEEDEKTGQKSKKPGEADKFLTPELRAATMVMDSNNVNKCLAAVKNGSCKILIVSPDMLRNKQKELEATGFGGERSMYIADEAHRLAIGQTEGEGSGMARAADAFGKSEYLLSGSGTLLENNASELWSTLNRTHPGEYGTQQQFTQEWQRLAQGGGDLFASEAMRGMRDRLSGVMVSYHKPVTKENGDPLTLTKDTVTVKATPTQKAAIAKINEQYKKDRASEDSSIAKAAALTRDARIKRILTAGVKNSSGRIDNPKMEALQKIMADEKARDPKNRVGVYSKELAPLRAARESLKGHTLASITGSDNDKETRTAISSINDRNSKTDGVTFTDAGATGVNMQGLDHIVKMAPSDVPSLEDQIDHRHFRTGQTRDVRSTVLMTDHPLEQVRQFRTTRVKLPEVALLAQLADDSGAAGMLGRHIGQIEKVAGERL